MLNQIINFVNTTPWIMGVGDAKPSADVYRTYSQWLVQEDAFNSIVQSFVGSLIKLLYSLTHGIETAFNFIFKLTGFTTYSQLNNFQKIFMAFGFAIFALVLGLFALEMITGKKLQVHNMLINALVAVGIVVILPQAMGVLSSFTTSANSAISNANTNNGQKGSNSLALEAVKDNVVDVGLIAQNKFSKTPNDIIKAGNPTNGITDKNIGAINFGQMISQGNGDGTGNKTGDYSKYKAPKYGKGVNSGDILLYGLNNKSQGGYFSDDVIKVADSHWIFKNQDNGYKRYIFNVLPMIAESLILIALFILSGIKIVKLIFELAIMRVLAVITAFSSLKSSGKVKELINTIFWSYMAIVLQLTMIKIFMIFIQFGSAKISGSSLNLAEKGFVAIILYIGAFYGVFSGSGFIDKMTGISSGTGDETQQLLATYGGAKLLMGGGHGGGASSGGSQGQQGGDSGPGTPADNQNLQSTNVDQSPVSENSNSNDNQNDSSSANQQDNQNDQQSSNDQQQDQQQNEQNSNQTDEQNDNQSENPQTEEVDQDQNVDDQDQTNEEQTNSQGDSNSNASLANQQNENGVNENNNVNDGANSNADSGADSDSGVEDTGSGNVDDSSEEVNDGADSGDDNSSQENADTGQANVDDAASQDYNGEEEGNSTNAEQPGENEQPTANISSDDDVSETTNVNNGPETPGATTNNTGDNANAFNNNYDTNNLHNTTYASNENSAPTDHGNAPREKDIYHGSSEQRVQNARANSQQALQNLQQGLASRPVLHGKTPDEAADDYL